MMHKYSMGKNLSRKRVKLSLCLLLLFNLTWLFLKEVIRISPNVFLLEKEVVFPSTYRKKFLYVYDVPKKFTTELLSESMSELVPGTKYSQWQSEFYLHQLLKGDPRVTTNPEEATIFYIPLYGSGMKTLSASVRVRVWDELLIWLKEQKSKSNVSFFEKRGGMDHAISLGASRSWCKVNFPDRKTPKCLGLSHKMLFESNLIKLTVEFTGLKYEHFQRNSLKENLGRILIIPYMQYDVKRAFGFDFFSDLPPDVSVGKRQNLLYFSGSLLPKTAPFSKIFKDVCDKVSGCSFVTSMRRKLNTTQMSFNFHHSTFCAILGGDTRASKRFFDAVTSGCIPVTFDPLLMLPFMTSIPYENFVVRAPFIQSSNEVRETIRIIQNISDDRVIEMQKWMKQYSSYLSYLSEIRPNAVDMIVDRLFLLGDSLRTLKSFKKKTNGIIHDDWRRLESMICITNVTDSCVRHTQTIA